jgi:sulfite reductase (NADPH) hemoprotein beta-component
MYRYDDFDRTYVAARSAEFRTQVERRIKGELTEDEFKPLRLMNGLYLQLHAYMLGWRSPTARSSAQMRQLAMIAERWDKGYGHFTTRQNIQFNWPKLDDVPDILEALAEVEMHAIQTSGNCIRNVTADQFRRRRRRRDRGPAPALRADLAPVVDRHPEFSSCRASSRSRSPARPSTAPSRSHDIGLRMHRNEAGEPASR